MAKKISKRSKVLCRFKDSPNVGEFFAKYVEPWRYEKGFHIVKPINDIRNGLEFYPSNSKMLVKDDEVIDISKHW